jgi:hypothetical protein
VGGGRIKNMRNNTTYIWSVDDVFDPKSKFWKTIYNEAKNYVEDSGDDVFDIKSEVFKTRINDIVEYFKNKNKAEQISKTMSKDIQETEFLVVNTIWNLLSEEDRDILFHNDIDYFTDWMDTCPQPLLDAYIRKLSNGEILLQSQKDIKLPLDKKEICTASIVNGKLVLCSTNHTTLKKFTKILINHGNRVEAYKEEKTDSNLILHSYIFRIKEK